MANLTSQDSFSAPVKQDVNLHVSVLSSVSNQGILFLERPRNPSIDKDFTTEQLFQLNLQNFVDNIISPDQLNNKKLRHWFSLRVHSLILPFAGYVVRSEENPVLKGQVLNTLRVAHDNARVLFGLYPREYKYRYEKRLEKVAIPEGITYPTLLFLVNALGDHVRRYVVPNGLPDQLKPVDRLGHLGLVMDVSNTLLSVIADIKDNSRIINPELIRSIRSRLINNTHQSREHNISKDLFGVKDGYNVFELYKIFTILDTINFNNPIVLKKQIAILEEASESASIIRRNQEYWSSISNLPQLPALDLEKGVINYTSLNILLWQLKAVCEH